MEPTIAIRGLRYFLFSLFLTPVFPNNSSVLRDASKPLNEGQAICDTLKSYVGLKEATGKNDGPFFDKLNDLCNVPRGSAYCASFVAYGHVVNNADIPGGCAWSPSWFPNSKVIWNRGDDVKLQKGDVFGLYFPNLKRVAHVGVVVEEYRDGYVLTVEGNTGSNSGRDGDGVYMRLRPKKQLFVASRWY